MRSVCLGRRLCAETNKLHFICCVGNFRAQSECVCVFVYVYTHLWRLEVNFWESVLSAMGSRN